MKKMINWIVARFGNGPALKREKLTGMYQLMVQVNGHQVDFIDVEPGAKDTDIERSAKWSRGAQNALDGKSIRRIVIVPKMLVNIITEEIPIQLDMESYAPKVVERMREILGGKQTPSFA